MRKGDLNTHIVQIPDEPHQILVLKVWNTFFVLLPKEEECKSLVKICWAPVGERELLQGYG